MFYGIASFPKHIFFTFIAYPDCIFKFLSSFAAPPKIKTKPSDIDVHADIKIEVDVEVEGIPKPKVQFYKDGKVLKQSERIKIAESGSKHTLIFEKTSLNDAGKYI